MLRLQATQKFTLNRAMGRVILFPAITLNYQQNFDFLGKWNLRFFKSEYFFFKYQ